MTDHRSGYGRLLDMLGECNAYGYAVTIAGMGSGSRPVTATATNGGWVIESHGPTLTLALESLRRKARRTRRAGGQWVAR